MLTPTRVPMGSTDAVAYCQGVVEEVLGELIGQGIIAWLDDILGYAADETALMKLLRRVLEKCAQYGLKLHAKKCFLFKKEVTWCGKVVSAAGVSHCPKRVQGMVDMQSPTTAGELQQLLCALNWMRQSIPHYSQLTAGLSAVLEEAMKLAGSRKKNRLSKILLSDVGFGEESLKELAAVKAALVEMVPLAHPSPDAEVCVYTDASQDYWGAVVTQLEPGEAQLPLEQQNHRPLAFLSGRFVGAASRWPTIEKEAFAIVEATRRLEYLLLRPGGFRLYTDHRNLVYIFAPHGENSTMARYQADKLQRWAMSLMSFKYVIEHVPGESNVWGDLLSRWGAGTPSERPMPARMARLVVTERVSPLQEKDFVWPDEEEIRVVQREARETALMDPEGTDEVEQAQWDDVRQVYLTKKGCIWIPTAASELQQRLCVVAHAGAAGHRGARATATALEELFDWPTLRDDVKAFVSGCLHCMVTASGKIPRPLGEALHATKPNQLLHWDWLCIYRGTTGEKYVLVIKDDMSGFVELVACADATSDETYRALMDWFKRFGVVHQWVSDQGAHFKNQVIERLQRALGAHHHFTTAYTPWANGTVEVVNREILKVLKALLSERRLQPNDWPILLPIIQAALNLMPADRLGGATPLRAFTALTEGNMLRCLLHPREPLEKSIEWTEDEIKGHLESVRVALDGMHATMTDESEKRRRAARERAANRQGVQLIRFSEGDFVLAATATGKAGHKLGLVWRGPKRIVRALNDYTFEVQDLVAPFATTIRHAARLQLYREAARGQAEELMEQAIYGEGGHLVECIQDCRKSPATHQWEVLIKWYGLDDVEASWEPAEVIKEDVPVLFQRFVDADPSDAKRIKMRDALAVVEPTRPLWAPAMPRAKSKRRITSK
jgi:transposase InsO family protein